MTASWVEAAGEMRDAERRLWWKCVDEEDRGN